jgi:SAM-dependent methyltransferase
MHHDDGDTIRTEVRRRYATAALTVHEVSAGCCAIPGPEGGFGSTHYDAADLDALPATALAASLGCGNPTALTELQPGQIVLDLGSGGGIDVLLSARRVAPGGKAYGLDMTPEMLELAQRNQAEAGVENAEFLHGTLEDIPLPDASVDVVISNCVINLAADKDVVLREAYRVLRPGGRFAVSDVVLRRPLPPRLAELVGLWTGCVAGALVDTDYEAKLAAAGFTDVEIVTTHVHDRASIEQFAGQLELPADLDLASALDDVDGVVTNAFVRARRAP